jgi:hypothetical protein
MNVPSASEERENREPHESPEVRLQVMRPPSELPEVVVNDRFLHPLTAECIRLMQYANEPPWIFSQGMNLVRVVRDGSKRVHIQVLNPIRMRSRLSEIAYFVQAFKNGKEIAKRPIFPPLAVCKDILALPRPEFPTLRGIARCPVMHEDGTIVLEPGYDVRTGLYYDPGPGLEECVVPERPTESDVCQAVEILQEVLVDFPLIDATSVANTLALTMSPVLRPLIEGVVPLALVTATKNGSGKSLLTNVISLVASGHPPVMKALPSREEEIRKTLTASLSGCPATLGFDNVDRTLESPALAAALTMPVWTDRLLGTSRDIQVPNMTTWFANGNNLQLGGDLPRRSYLIRLDAKSAYPYIGRQYKHTDLIRWVTEHRSELVAAILTVARAWIQAGRPRGENPIIGSYEPWSEIIGGILHFAGVKGFLANAQQLYDEGNLDDLAWENLLLNISERFGDKAWPVRDLVRDFDWESVDVPANIDPSNPRSVGNAFAKRENTRYGHSGIHLMRAGTAQRAVLWRVRVG